MMKLMLPVFILGCSWPVYAPGETLKNLTIYSKTEYKCRSVEGNAPTSMLEDQARGATFKTIIAGDGTVYMYTPGQKYGMKFVSGKTIHFKVPLSHGDSDATTTLSIKGNKLVGNSSNVTETDSLRGIQTGTFVSTLSQDRKSCSGSGTTDIDYNSTGLFGSKWKLHCDVTVLECDVAASVQGDE